MKTSRRVPADSLDGRPQPRLLVPKMKSFALSLLCPILMSGQASLTILTAFEQCFDFVVVA